MNSKEVVDKNAEELGDIKLRDSEKPSKFVRIFTVGLYLFSVSLASILLALYYIFLWSEYILF